MELPLLDHATKLSGGPAADWMMVQGIAGRSRAVEPFAGRRSVELLYDDHSAAATRKRWSCGRVSFVGRIVTSRVKIESPGGCCGTPSGRQLGLEKRPQQHKKSDQNRPGKRGQRSYYKERAPTREASFCVRGQSQSPTLLADIMKSRHPILIPRSDNTLGGMQRCAPKLSLGEGNSIVAQS
jgi:hypothetical protein